MPRKNKSLKNSKGIVGGMHEVSSMGHPVETTTEFNRQEQQPQPYNEMNNEPSLEELSKGNMAAAIASFQNDDMVEVDNTKNSVSENINRTALSSQDQTIPSDPIKIPSKLTENYVADFIAGKKELPNPKDLQFNNMDMLDLRERYTQIAQAKEQNDKLTKSFAFRLLNSFGAGDWYAQRSLGRDLARCKDINSLHEAFEEYSQKENNSKSKMLKTFIETRNKYKAWEQEIRTLNHVEYTERPENEAFNDFEKGIEHADTIRELLKKTNLTEKDKDDLASSSSRAGITDVYNLLSKEEIRQVHQRLDTVEHNARKALENDNTRLDYLLNYSRKPTDTATDTESSIKGEFEKENSESHSWLGVNSKRFTGHIDKISAQTKKELEERIKTLLNQEVENAIQFGRDPKAMKELAIRKDVQTYVSHDKIRNLLSESSKITAQNMRNATVNNPEENISARLRAIDNQLLQRLNNISNDFNYRRIDANTARSETHDLIDSVLKEKNPSLLKLQKIADSVTTKKFASQELKDRLKTKIASIKSEAI